MEIDAVEFDQLVKQIFAPAYPLIAEQIIARTGITSGCCIDVGCGNGYLGLALARITQLQIILFDESPQMLELAQNYIVESKLESRASVLQGDVHSIPLADESVNLIISRGSMFFWEDLVQAYQELYRILAPGGMTCIGGGFGSKEVLKKIEQEMLLVDPEWSNKRKKRVGKDSIDDYKNKLEQAGVKDYIIEQNESGLWIIMKK